MSPRYFVNHKTRMCRILSGRTSSSQHLKNINEAQLQGFVEVVSSDELDAFRAVTQEAKDSGWNPDRMRYDTWLKKQVKP